MTTIRVPVDRQGQADMGQGGYTCHRFATAIGGDVTLALRSKIPLETDLEIVESPSGWQLIEPANPEVPIIEATPWTPDFAATEPVTIEQATAARAAFSLAPEDHIAPLCVSCGLGEQSLRVHPGPLGDGRVATPFHAPDWATVDGEVDEGLLWMAMDCSCGWFISYSDEPRNALTVQFAVTVHERIVPHTDYALVAWHGDYDPGWDGRKRGAAAALFDADGALVAQCRSFWVAIE